MAKEATEQTDVNKTQEQKESEQSAEEQRDATATDAAATDAAAADAAAPAGDTRERDGILADLQVERQRRQQVELDYAELRGQMTEKTAAAAAEPEPDPIGDLEDDDILTAKQFRAARAHDQRQTAEANKLREDQDRQRRATRGQAAARTTYATGNVTAGLEYDRVIAAGKAYLTPFDVQAIQAADDPAAEAYKRCIMCAPQLAALQAGGTVVPSPAPAGKPAADAVVTAPAVTAPADPFKGMSTEEALRMVLQLDDKQVDAALAARDQE